MNRLARFGPFLVALGLCLAFAAIFPSWFLSYVLKPLAISLWLTWRLVMSVDQNVYWTLLLLVCAAWAIVVLTQSFGEVPAAPKSSAPPPVEAHVAGWQALLQDAFQTSDGDQALQTRLLRLLAAIIGIPEGLDIAELEHALTLQRIAVPRAVHDYLFFAPGGAARARSRLLGRLFSSAALYFRGLSRRPAPSNSAAIDELLRWMESMMEIRHDQ
jgi:hypothetical protein